MRRAPAVQAQPVRRLKRLWPRLQTASSGHTGCPCCHSPGPQAEPAALGSPSQSLPAPRSRRWGAGRWLGPGLEGRARGDDTSPGTGALQNVVPPEPRCCLLGNLQLQLWPVPAPSCSAGFRRFSTPCGLPRAGAAPQFSLGSVRHSGPRLGQTPHPRACFPGAGGRGPGGTDALIPLLYQERQGRAESPIVLLRDRRGRLRTWEPGGQGPSAAGLAAVTPRHPAPCGRPPGPQLPRGGPGSARGERGRARCAVGALTWRTGLQRAGQRRAESWSSSRRPAARAVLSGSGRRPAPPTCGLCTLHHGPLTSGRRTPGRAPHPHPPSPAATAGRAPLGTGSLSRFCSQPNGEVAVRSEIPEKLVPPKNRGALRGRPLEARCKGHVDARLSRV